MSEQEHALLLRFIASLTLADHAGDVDEDIVRVLKEAGIDLGEWESRSDLRRALAKRGVTTLYGTTLSADDEEEDEDED